MSIRTRADLCQHWPGVPTFWGTEPFENLSCGHPLSPNSVETGSPAKPCGRGIGTQWLSSTFHHVVVRAPSPPAMWSRLPHTLEFSCLVCEVLSRCEVLSTGLLQRRRPQASVPGCASPLRGPQSKPWPFLALNPLTPLLHRYP